MMLIETRETNYDFHSVLEKHGLRIAPLSLNTLWLNITRLCNQTCEHCHVDASPVRREQMSRQVMERCLEILSSYKSCQGLVITGGAPELNPDFDFLVTEARKLNKNIVVRHNLTVILDGNPQTGEQKTHLAGFFAQHKIEIIASLPHYRKDITDKQRGNGAFEKSIEGIRQLNAVGYGKDGSGLILNLAYNPGGTELPADRLTLEARFKQALWSRYGLLFNELHTITNMPVNRFRVYLQRSGNYGSYMTRLANAFNPLAAEGVMCRSAISVDYRGRVYDCDFNQMLGMQIVDREPLTVFNLDLDTLMKRKIQFAPHCFGCTAGAGDN